MHLNCEVGEKLFVGNSTVVTILKIDFDSVSMLVENKSERIEKQLFGKSHIFLDGFSIMRRFTVLNQVSLSISVNKEMEIRRVKNKKNK